MTEPSGMNRVVVLHVVGRSMKVAEFVAPVISAETIDSGDGDGIHVTLLAGIEHGLAGDVLARRELDQWHANKHEERL